MTLSRRGLLGIGTAFLAAPAIVRVASIMPVSVVEPAGREYLHTLEPPGWLYLRFSPPGEWRKIDVITPSLDLRAAA